MEEPLQGLELAQPFQLIEFHPKALSDITIIHKNNAGGLEGTQSLPLHFKLHKSILCNKSKYFNDLLISDNGEKLMEPDLSVIELKDDFTFDSDILTIFFTLLYDTNKFELSSVEYQENLTLLKMVDYFGVESMYPIFQEQMFKLLKKSDDKDLWFYLRLSIQYKWKNIEDFCCEKLLKIVNFEKNITTTDYTENASLIPSKFLASFISRLSEHNFIYPKMMFCSQVACNKRTVVRQPYISCSSCCNIYK